MVLPRMQAQAGQEMSLGGYIAQVGFGAVSMTEGIITMTFSKSVAFMSLTRPIHFYVMHLVH